MTIKMMRAIDRFAGVPLCWLAGAWNRLSAGRKPEAVPGIQTVLVIKFFGLGSVLLSTPVLAQLLHALPRARVIYLTFSSNRELLEKTGLPIEIITVSPASTAAFAATTASAFRRLRNASIDVVFDLEFFSKFSTLISGLCGARVRIGFDMPTRWRRSNLTHPVSLDHSLHVSGLFLRQLKAIGLDAPATVNIIGPKPSPGEKAAMERQLGLAGDTSEVISVNINAGSTSLERRWRPHRFVEVAMKLLHENPSRKIYFIGNADEHGYVDDALRSAGDGAGALRNCCGALSLGELVALLERSSFLLTNDSGPMHIAAAAGVPVVALFGPETPAFYGPGGRSRICYKATSCSPCLNIYNAKQFVCPYNTRCMEEISTDEVLEAIDALASDVRVHIS